ncbi:MAG: hypothetical protein IJX89_03400 [Alphaproteobacteria bacterium]|nr:hypothetical protein [Alphaproteobacteria bacterium]
MKWFDYLKKTPVVQIVADWQEYRKLKQETNAARDDADSAYLSLRRFYPIEANINSGNACVKCKRIIDDFDVLNQSPCNYFVVYCPHFAPRDQEKKCSNNLCVGYRANNRYYDARVRYDALKAKSDAFWNKKFANVK